MTCLGALLWVGAAHAQAAAETPAEPATSTEQPSTSAEQQPDERTVKEAGERYNRGLQLYTEGDYALAVIEFERAYSLVPDYRVLYNIGLVRLQLANYAKARRALEQYLKEGGERVPEERRKAVGADLEMLAARTASVRIETNVAGADVIVDDVSVGTAPLAEPLLLDAGEHRIVVQLPGYQPRATQLTLAGLDDKSLRIDLEKVPEGKASQIIVQKGESNRSAWLWATWSATGAFAIGSGVLEGLGVKAANDLDELRSDKTATRGELDSASRRARTLLTVGDVLGGLAIATGGVAIYLTLSAPSSEAPAEAGKKAAKRDVKVVARSNFVGLSGRF